MRNLTMLTDLYQMTMMNGYIQAGIPDRIAVFDLFYRKNPGNAAFAVNLEAELAVEVHRACRRARVTRRSLQRTCGARRSLRHARSVCRSLRRTCGVCRNPQNTLGACNSLPFALLDFLGVGHAFLSLSDTPPFQYAAF